MSAERDAELHDLLSALLDGELSAADEAEVRAYLERSPAAADDFAALAGVRTLVRDLPAVDPPFGFYERMLRPEKRPRRLGLRVGGAVAAAAAAIVVLMGITPVTDRIVPPVNAYAERHEHMVNPAPGTPGSGTIPSSSPPSTDVAPTTSLPVTPAGAATTIARGLAPTGTNPSANQSTNPDSNPDTNQGTTAPSSDEPAAPVGSTLGGTAPSASSTAAHAVPTAAGGREPSSGGFSEVPAAQLDTMGVPATLPAGFHRIGGYQGSGGVLHLMYSDDHAVVSVFEQPGEVVWGSLPSAGSTLTIGGDPAWQMTSDNHEEVLVVEKDTTVYTLVAMDAHDGMVAVVEDMPSPPPPAMVDRVHQACRSVVDHFGFGDG
jgi:hypothetical protein